MKKTIFVMAAMAALTSCGGSSETAPVADSVVVVDTVTIDSVSVEEVVETTDDIQGGGGHQDGSEIK